MDLLYTEKGENYNIKKQATVKVTTYTNTNEKEVQDIKNKSNINFRNCRRINGKEYVDAETGEIKKYNNNKTKTTNGIRRSMNKLRKVIKNNFTGAGNELFITLTTEEVVSDFDTIIDFFNTFWEELKKLNKNLECVYVVELQEERNSWHIHALIKDTTRRRLYIDNEIVANLWGKGNTKTSRIKKRGRTKEFKRVGTINTNNEIEQDEIIGINAVIAYMTKVRTKEQVPRGKRCYGRSNGIKTPITTNSTYEEFSKQINDDYILQNESTILLRNKETKSIVNKIKYETWKKR